MMTPPPRRWHWRSLRLRVLGLLLLWIALGIGGIAISADRLFTRHVEQQFHDELNVHVRELAGLVRIGADGSAEMVRPLSDPRYLEPLSGYYWQVRLDGRNVLRSPSLKTGDLDASFASAPQIRHGGAPGPTGPTIVYGFARPAAEGRQVHFAIATDQRHLDVVTSRFRKQLLAWLAGLTVAMLATGYALLTFGLAPLDHLRRAMARLRSGSDDRLRGPFPSEIHPLAEDLNSFIDHTSKSTALARAQAGNLAHALRTPLAVIADEAEQLIVRGAAAGSGEVLLEQVRRMASHIEYQLARARTASSPQMPGVTSNVAMVIASVAAALRRLYPDIEIAIDDRCDGQAILPIDPVDLTELLSILLDNACKWGRSKVGIAIVTGPSGTEVRIHDDGPGIAEDQIELAFEVGTRLDPTRPGNGLGLAIAREIAELYNLGLTLRRSSQGTGMIASVIAPAVAS